MMSRTALRFLLPLVFFFFSGYHAISMTSLGNVQATNFVTAATTQIDLQNKVVELQETIDRLNSTGTTLVSLEGTTNSAYSITGTGFTAAYYIVQEGTKNVVCRPSSETLIVCPRNPGDAEVVEVYSPTAYLGSLKLYMRATVTVSATSASENYFVMPQAGHIGRWAVNWVSGVLTNNKNDASRDTQVRRPGDSLCLLLLARGSAVDSSYSSRILAPVGQSNCCWTCTAEEASVTAMDIDLVSKSWDFTVTAGETISMWFPEAFSQLSIADNDGTAVYEVTLYYV